MQSKDRLIKDQAELIDALVQSNERLLTILSKYSYMNKELADIKKELYVLQQGRTV